MNLLLPTMGGSGLYLSFNITSWLMVVLIITLGFIQVAKQKTVIYHKSFVWLSLGTVLLLVPFLYNAPFQDHMVLRILAVVGGIMLFFTCCQFKQLRDNPTQILWLVLIAATIQITISFGQIFWPNHALYAWFNPDVQKPFGLFLQPNVMATFLTTTIGIGIYLLSEKRYSRKITTWIFLLLASAAFILPLLDSLSGWLSLMLVTVLLLPKTFRYNKTMASMQFLVLLVCLLLSQTFFVKSQQQTPISQDNNISVRQDIYLTTLKMIADKPFQGYGYGSFERAYLDYYNAMKVEQPMLNPPLLKLNHPHNEILYWVVEGGIAAALAMICFVIAYFTLFNTDSRFCWPQVLALLGLVSPIVFHAMVEIPFDSAASHWHLLIFLLFFTLATSNQSLKSQTLPSGILPVTGALLTAGFFVPFLLTTMHTLLIIVKHEVSGFQKIETFKEIINPLPLRERMLLHVNTHKYLKGIKEKKPELLVQYIQWAKQQLRFKPRIEIYRDLLLCLKILQRESEYQAYLNEAQKTYPNEPHWLATKNKTIN